ncbi:MAG: crossover junction endodeoxyribonuclease RuvC, partial [Dehalococcoidia bacterium]|nr:crossover junction endodeoxyribonuclease RuvC [Dehalococcoidia bacterium]
MKNQLASRRVMGIDPGTVRMGYGVVDEGNKLTAVCYGAISASSKIPIAERLHRMYCGLCEIITCYQPMEVAIEEPFVAKNVRSAMAVGRAQAVAMLVAASEGLPVFGYAPTQVKL